MVRLSYWVFPILAGTVWLATLLALLLYWIVEEDSVHYPSMSENQQIAYISDVGAYTLKPLFVTGCVLTTVLLDISFGADRYLRHKGRLASNTRRTEHVFFALTIFFALVGTVGLILLSVFDTARYERLHRIFLLVFIVGYVLSAIFICCEYWCLGKTHRQERILRRSFWIKLTFVVVEVLLAVAFVACTWTGHYNAGAVLEWVIALIFSAYIFSFFIDLYPAAKRKHQHRPRQRQHRKGRPARGRGDRYGVSSEMEEGTSDGTLGSGSDPARHEMTPYNAAGVASHGRRSGSMNRVLARNF